MTNMNFAEGKAVQALGISLALSVLIVFAFVLYAHADVRNLRDRTDGRIPQEDTSAPADTTPAPKLPEPKKGGISSSTFGSVNTGGNEGGHVVTGDEHVEVFEINIWPTNPPEEAEEDEEEVNEPAPTPQEPCDARSRTGCAVQSPARTR